MLLGRDVPLCILNLPGQTVVRNSVEKKLLAHDALDISGKPVKPETEAKPKAKKEPKPAVEKKSKPKKEKQPPPSPPAKRTRDTPGSRRVNKKQKTAWGNCKYMISVVDIRCRHMNQELVKLELGLTVCVVLRFDVMNWWWLGTESPMLNMLWCFQKGLLWSVAGA